MRPNETSRAVIGAALRVHSALGPGVFERTVAACLHYELLEKGLHVQHQVHLPVVYRTIAIPLAYRVDFIVENCLVVEIKCVENLLRVHLSQVVTYLKLTGLNLGLLINFNVPHLKQGIRRVINGPQSNL